MIRISIIVILGIFFGLSPKKIENSVLYKLGGVSVLLGVLFAGLAAAFGYSPIQVITLEVSHITVSGLTITYALLLGIAIKLLRNVFSTANT